MANPAGKGLKLYKKDDWSRPVEHPESVRLGPERYREAARRDYARLIHCPSFRRLQGKTQLFPSSEGDFFRNRLTHSLEVAQIAKSIAIRANGTNPFFQKNRINTDLVEFAGLAHDIGHPPFGHNGENALDKLMLNAGGFEGNAQTLRILTRIEKKSTIDFPLASSLPLQVDSLTKRDCRLGLNLTYRSLASILKYDNVIPNTRRGREAADSDRKPLKGFYESEKDIVDKIKKACGGDGVKDFRSIECCIMDIADDIAYSTYDIEDSFKANFLSPARMIAMDDDFKERVVKKVLSGVNDKYKHLPESDRNFNASEFDSILGSLFSHILEPDQRVLGRMSGGVTPTEAAFILSAPLIDRSYTICRNGYLRTAFTSELVGRFIRGVEFEINEDNPALSIARLDLGTFKIVETLKHFAYEILIQSPMLKISERRGSEIINKIFDTFKSDCALLPEDWSDLFKAIDDDNWQSRVVCDYIAGMTDRYCVEMYARLTSENPISIWKPH